MNESIQVLAADTGLGEHLRPDRLEAARRECVARVRRLAPSDAGILERPAGTPIGLGLLVLDGLMLRRVGLAGRFGAELLGEGDLLRPWQGEDGGTLSHVGKWRVLQPGHVAILDGDFTLRACRYPELIAALVGRAVQRSRHLAVHVAMMHQPRIDIRLHMLFWELADRWGIVRGDGVHLPLRLTHSVLSELVGARRPTVTKSLGDLAESGTVRWTGRDWLLRGEPPSELHALGEVPVSPESEGEGNGAPAADRHGAGVDPSRAGSTS